MEVDYDLLDRLRSYHPDYDATTLGDSAVYIEMLVNHINNLERYVKEALAARDCLSKDGRELCSSNKERYVSERELNEKIELWVSLSEELGFQNDIWPILPEKN